ncbi:hypothetical protein BDV18DRAFT_134987 [Aspergillus unguis]
MKSISLSSVFATVALLLSQSSPAAAGGQETYIGCFTSSEPLEDLGAYQYQSNGYCLNQCYGKNKAVFGLYNGNHCLCGDELPAKSDEEDNDDKCNVACAAWPIVMCGGSNAYSIYLTGYKSNVAYYSDDSSSTTSSSNSSTSTSSNNSTTTKTGDSSSNGGSSTETTTANNGQEMATVTTSPEDATNNKDGPNTAAIAAGVVIGVVGFAALVGAGFFLWRFKKRHPADKRMREMSNVEQFGKPVSQDSMSDSRFDGDFMAQRRQSNGSIDDDRDFSRRILQVTNPDRH